MVIFRKVFYGICSSFAPLKLARWSNALCKLKYLTWLPLRPIEGQFVPARQIKTRRERENNTIVRPQQRTFSIEIELRKKWRFLCAFFLWQAREALKIRTHVSVLSYWVRARALCALPLGLECFLSSAYIVGLGHTINRTAQPGPSQLTSAFLRLL